MGTSTNSLAALDQRLSAFIHQSTLPFLVETVFVMPFGCIHGYAGGMVGIPAGWLLVCWLLGARDSHGLPGFFLYMYTAAVGQCISRLSKVLIARERPGMSVTGRAELPLRHWLPGSPAFISAFPMEELQRSPLVRVGGLQHGRTKGVMGADSGAFPSGDAMAGASFAVLLAWYSPLGLWGGLAYCALPCFARVYYWFHWIGDVIAVS
jgi:membrane-associated phospholipid phosphatase